MSSATLAIGTYDTDSDQTNLGLCAFLWEVVHANKETNGNEANSKDNYFLGIFGTHFILMLNLFMVNMYLIEIFPFQTDLNAWYQAQMPSHLELEPGTQCSYFSVCSLNDVFPDDDRGLGNMIDCRIDLSTLSRYHSNLNIEQHYYPSSLAFKVVCLLENAMIEATHLGLQRKVLLEMRSQGKDNIVDPRALYDLCRVAGLVDINSCEAGTNGHAAADPEDLKLQRKAILTVALEHHFLDFLKSCLTHWHDGKLQHDNL